MGKREKTRGREEMITIIIDLNNITDGHNNTNELMYTPLLIEKIVGYASVLPHVRL